ncbi:phospholipase/carboxylesterase [Microvirga lupini]|uniref:Phospholipase/carboxylesterase n=1 Tax=Microvirga lupini TaxID=420324 RepID=A0A7W4VNN2_9HYPH|nr:dienelactone hydrolase family protein [Microvirga lupini]MBB3020473.1 phospholipase/carboxylesterase [Microvirga lupini]
MASIDGPRLSPRSGVAKQLVVFLHGLGADGNDLIELGEQWRAWLPDAAFVAPHAPDPCSNVPMGREWFPLTLTDPREFWRGVTYAGPGLDAFIDQELARHDLPPSRLALVGFSQGAMMALHVGLRRPTPPAAILGYSGLLVLEDGEGPEGLMALRRTAPPILLIHGDRDDVVPVEMFFFSKEALGAAEIPCQWHISPGLGHGIDGEGLRQGGLFLTQSFGLPSPEKT